MTDRLKIGMGFQLTTYTGWGVVAMNIALELAAMPDVDLSFWSADFQGLDALSLERLRPIAERCQRETAIQLATKQPYAFDGVLLTAEGNQCSGPPRSRFPNARHLGLMVFEDTALTPEKIERLRGYDWLVTASRWNQQVLQSHGLSSVLIPQGIDPTIWHPAPKSGRWRDRFLVFSGGKLEYRKGQDITLAAFRAFHAKHPEALLVTCWGNRWPQLCVDMTLAGHVEHAPVVTADGVDVEGWFADNGLPDGAAIDVGTLPNVMLAPIVRECDVAVFCSRAEGGTNLMAMECMAAGVPTIVSRNTGHCDLSGALRVPCVSPCKVPSQFFGAVEGWGETAPADLAHSLATHRQGLGLYPMSDPVTWQQHTAQLVETIRASA